MKEQILEAAEQMIQDRGLNAVSFQQLATAVGMGKASVFHHFPTKEALSLAIVDCCRTKHAPIYSAIVDSNQSAPDKLLSLAELFKADLKNGRVCLLGTLGSSYATLPASVQDALAATIEASASLHGRVFEQGRREKSLFFKGTPKALGLCFLSTMQGLQFLARASGDLSSFQRSASAFVKTLEGNF